MYRIDNPLVRATDSDPLGFLVSQVANIEAGVDLVDHSEIQYPTFMHVETGQNEWAANVTYFSMDMTGSAQWFGGYAQDMPFADITRDKHEVPIHMAAIGYTYTIEEIMQAQMAGWTLTSERASAARETANKFVDRIAKTGDTAKGWYGLYNQATGITTTATSARWVTGKNDPGRVTATTDGQILSDVNSALGGVFASTDTVHYADTLLVPPVIFSFLASTPRSVQSDKTMLEWIKTANVYTARTGNMLTIVPGVGLDDVGTNGRMVAYKNDRKVVRLHYPMPHRFRPPREIGAGIGYVVPGIMRIGGVEIKRPSAVRYVDNFWA